MSTGVYALIGVVVGGVLTAASQIVVGVVMARRREKADWRVASRLVTAELDILLVDLRTIIEQGTTPSFPVDELFLRTAMWDEYRYVVARGLPNTDAGDDFWRHLFALNAVTAERLRPLLRSVPAGTPLGEDLINVLRDGFAIAWRAYEAMTGVKPTALPLPPASSS